MKTKNYLFTTLLFLSFLMFSCASEENLRLSAENTISSFSITKGNISKEFTVSDNSISGNVETGFELTDIKLLVSIPKGATISPEPATIKSITGPFTFIVKAENGENKSYNVSIKRELDVDNSISKFDINTGDFAINVKIDEKTGVITKRLPEFIDFKNLSINLQHSKYATVSPDPKTIKDYSSPVSFTVKSESGVEKIYQVKLEHMDIDKRESCSETNTSKWFGGDDRDNAPDILPFDRNVGTGQTVILSKDFTPSIFSIRLQGGFIYSKTYTEYNKPVQIKLIIRDENQKILGSAIANVSGQFNGGFIPFDLQSLKLFFEAGKTYNFYWYLVDGEKLGVTAGSLGNNNSGSGFCFSSGYSGESKLSKKNSLEDMSVWYKHEWHFNIELAGKE